MATEQRDREAREGHDGPEKRKEAPRQAGTRTDAKPEKDRAHGEPGKRDKARRP